MTENQEINVKLIRLNTGEDIVASCLMDDETGEILVGNPMKVYVKRVSEAGQTLLVMMPWLPLELIEDDFATLNFNDVITMVELKKSFVEYYMNTVSEYHALLEKKEMEIEEEQEEEPSEEEMQTMLDALKESRRNKLH